MWRNARSFSSKLLFSHNTNGLLRPHPPSRFHPNLSNSSSAPPLSESLKLGFQGSNGIRAATAVDFSSLAASKAREAADLARHYGRCYYELSKARLSLLVVATSGTGFVLGSGSAVDLSGLFWTCTGTMMVAASANSLNQISLYDRRMPARLKGKCYKTIVQPAMLYSSECWATTGHNTHKDRIKNERIRRYLGVALIEHKIRESFNVVWLCVEETKYGPN